MKAYKVTLVYQVFADCEADAQIQALQSSCLNLSKIGCEEIEIEHEQEQNASNLLSEDIPF